MHWTRRRILGRRDRKGADAVIDRRLWPGWTVSEEERKRRSLIKKELEIYRGNAE